MIHGITSRALLLGLSLALLSSCAVNPITGEEELMFFSTEDDLALGRKYAPYVEKKLGGRIPDESLQSYINRVGQRIARFCHRPDMAYRFAGVDTDMANAIAMPGGYVFITRGLLEELESEAQLAAILGHEVGHVVARDSMAAMSREIGMGALVAAAHVSDVPSVASASLFITSVLSLQYSREDEVDADMVGLSYMVQAGYDPNGIVETMQILEDLQTVRPIEFFSTHPNPENRIAYLKEHITKERVAGRYPSMGALKKGEEEYAARVLAPLNKRKKRPQVQIPETAREE